MATREEAAQAATKKDPRATVRITESNGLHNASAWTGPNPEDLLEAAHAATESGAWDELIRRLKSR